MSGFMAVWAVVNSDIEGETLVVVFDVESLASAFLEGRPRTLEVRKLPVFDSLEEGEQWVAEEEAA